MSNKIMITAALTGAVTPKELNDSIPLTPEEIAEDAYQCWKAGASIVHLHMRDEAGKGSMDAARFRKTIELLRAYEDCDVVICCTSSGTYPPVGSAERMAHFKSIPEIEMGSYDAGTFNWGCDVVFDNTPQFLTELGMCYQEYDVKAELEIFDMGMLGNVKHYLKKGVLQTPPYCQFVLGVLGGMEASVENLQYLVRHMPEGSIWSAFGIGKDHMPIMYAALALGANGIRVGLEDCVMYSKGVKATNVMLVERAVRVVEAFGKAVATPAEARKILGIKQLIRQTALEEHSEIGGI
ncbi:3-keto-5-aminohexanoate cleavage protein [Geosporobacter ferrireducens]|uniref:3-keto-5-aminohexanoate cleavage protein n=1 Tax=Geosporobacter ferrireducens TaxID=1424294 RepID=UPI00139C15AF|nr:3-keto-5-aminohexanoate cleavage protein [Geosporobacter ferrireducens]MTI56581.1 3-keto-5-aminohexanoate cleavage protein [Geosporobacter ferrireducens]